MDASKTVLALAAFVAAGAAGAAPQWSKVPSRVIPAFMTGTASLEWTLHRPDHAGARGMLKGESCAACHHDEAVDIGKKMVVKHALEPDPQAVKGRPGAIPVTVQAAHDGANLYLRFEWKAPEAAGGRKMDEKNAVKLAVMIGDERVEYASVGGCWASCHHDLRTMPDVDPNAAKHPRAKELDIRANGPTKYLKESRTALEIKSGRRGGWDKVKPEAEIAALLKEGRFLELMQFRSAAPPRRGYVLEARRLTETPGLATGRLEGGVWSVTFTRPLAGGPGSHAIVPGKIYNLSFAIHDDHADYRFHHVSFAYSLGLDNPKAEVNAVRQ
jgi:cytochrome c-type protein NapC